MYFEPDSARYEEEGVVPTLTELTDSGKKWILTNNYAIRWTLIAGFLRKKNENNCMNTHKHLNS